jgi:serine/threonine protein kinase
LAAAHIIGHQTTQVALNPGTRLGAYEILTALGSGAMGEVYRAKDTRLARDVAVKILPAIFTNDPDRIARFRREAQILATLNHPHIAHIHSLDEANGAQFLVLELVEGESLDRRIARGRIPIAEALAIGKQIAEALEAAHEKRIIHRDLKPANIALTADGVVKVLDFGLAKATGNAAPAPFDASGSTIAPPVMTELGAIVGTPAYMSPEQARGLEADRGSDIWALGCVLFEMLTGRRAFVAPTPAETIASVLGSEPDWSALPDDVLESVRQLVRRCLQKDPRNRLHDVADARIEIADALSSPPRRASVRPTTRGRGRLAIWVVSTVALAAMAVAALIWWRSSLQSAPDRQSVRAMEFGVTFPNNFMPTDGIAISPDGRHIAANVWSDSGNIWVHALDGTQPRPLPGGENAARPFWSPDSSMLGFFQGGQIVIMPATGGPRTVVAKLAQMGPLDLSAQQLGGSWNRDNVIVFSAGGKLFRVAASAASTPAELPVPGVSGELRAPVFLPDGRHFLFCAAQELGGQLHVAALDDDRARAVGASECPGGFAPPDRVLFVRGSSLLAQRLEMRRVTVEGEPQVIASNVTRGAVGPWPQLTLSASDAGALAFPAPRGGSSLGKLTWFDGDGRVIATIEPPSADVEYLNPAICPTNDNLVAANRLDPASGAWHIWLIDTARGNAASRLTTGDASDIDPTWSADGKEILYVSERNGRRGFYRQRIDGGAATRVLDVSGFSFPMPSDWSRDGDVLFSNLQQSIWAFRLGDRSPVQVQQRYSYGAHLSPDRKWLAYVASDGGSFKLFVERFPGGSPRIQIAAASHPRWINGGKSIAYWVPPGGIVSTDLTTTDQEIRIGATRTLLSQPVLTLIDARTHYDITADGRKILVRQPAGPPTPGIRLIVNWLDDLNARTAAK